MTVRERVRDPEPIEPEGEQWADDMDELEDQAIAWDVPEGSGS